jgi:hypothetical protein
MLLKRAMKGRLDILTPAKNVAKELISIPDFGSSYDTPFATERKLISQFKKAILLTAGAAVQKLMMKLESEQEVLMHIADMAMITFHAESALLRVMKLSTTKNENDLAFKLDILRTFLYDSADKIDKHGKDAINAFADGDEQRMLLMGLKRFSKASPFNSKEAKRRIADKLIALDKYPL